MMLGTQLLAFMALLAPLGSCSSKDKPDLEKAHIYAVSASTVSDRDSLNDNITSTRHNAITRAVAKASPAVVGINVTEIREQRIYDPFEGFDDPFFRQFFGNQRRGPTTQKYKVEGLGSGFLISPDGYILTNDHVAGNAAKIIVTTTSGKQYDAKLVATDPIQDVALVKIDAEDLPYLTLGNSDDLAIGEWAIAMGNPFGLFKTNDKPTVTVGVISNTGVNLGLEQGKNYRGMIQTDAAISSGNSGGPLLTANGEVIGINAIIHTTAQNYEGAGSIGLGFAIPINKVKTIIEGFRSGKKANRNFGSLGFIGQTLDDDIKQYINVQADDGLVVTNLYRNSPAMASGLQVGDVITAIDGEHVRSLEDLNSILTDRKVGDVVTFTVLRSEGKMQLKMQLPSAK
ncbi:MAG: trypsin-like peptidase domain-containing protein [Bacteroidota bacterium]|nr:trypsin-like peptidase domain-containing protein [Bacteroidota bacterium]MDP4230233.1 trypsin-like peptidase domain-containing protein [Bacteroidota bacterium]